MEVAEVNILAIETSCDDTAAAVLSNGNVLSNVISSQVVHDLYGGIVPELASREHMLLIAQIVDSAMAKASMDLASIDAIAVTSGPGLAGSLLVGTHFAKGLALALGVPLHPVHHIEAHLYSGYLEEPTLAYPSVTLVVSGGHTSIFLVESPESYQVLGSTTDDAAGEAFDKIAKMLGLGYPGGPAIDRHAAMGNAEAFAFPRSRMHEDSYDFSFSGLKSAVRRVVESLSGKDKPLPIDDLCASAQTAITDVLVSKTMRAAKANNVPAVTIAGGVSANTELRQRMADACSQAGMQFVAPRMQYCVDNAAMIGAVAAMRIARGHSAGTVDFCVDPKPIRRR
ncbi:MAG: tRNA (adenosine(37)-N6)-threonylcarbamoyltransferase complex transferase subunit TsaD [Candidatus Kapabacteria bacterium]|nr:tRNA (adenosine(37)-N6)-threonylcarbamoyltransferase complex transferase subunit TsaD [Candidatus Kapabacteria bacterium]